MNLISKLTMTTVGVALIALGIGGAAQAVTFTESGDAGELLNTAQVVGSGFDKISGRFLTPVMWIFTKSSCLVDYSRHQRKAVLRLILNCFYLTPPARELSLRTMTLLLETNPRFRRPYQRDFTT